jgi:hypothetical protein
LRRQYQKSLLSMDEDRSHATTHKNRIVGARGGFRYGNASIRSIRCSGAQPRRQQGTRGTAPTWCGVTKAPAMALGSGGKNPTRSRLKWRGETTRQGVRHVRAQDPSTHRSLEGGQSPAMTKSFYSIPLLPKKTSCKKNLHRGKNQRNAGASFAAEATGLQDRKSAREQESRRGFGLTYCS